MVLFARGYDKKIFRIKKYKHIDFNFEIVKMYGIEGTHRLGHGYSLTDLRPFIFKGTETEAAEIYATICAIQYGNPVDIEKSMGIKSGWIASNGLRSGISVFDKDSTPDDFGCMYKAHRHVSFEEIMEELKRYPTT